MSLFKHRHKYITPERLTPDEARERRLTALLEREQRFLEVQNFATTLERVRRDRSPENIKNRSTVTSGILNDRQMSGHKAALIAAALRTYTERDFQDAAKRQEYRRLRTAQQELENVRAHASDRRRFNPTGKNTASTIFGTAARLVGWNAVIPRFEFPAVTLPCIQRHAQREVMFAKGYAGRGYHTRKRRNWASGVPC